MDELDKVMKEDDQTSVQHTWIYHELGLFPGTSFCFIQRFKLFVFKSYIKVQCLVLFSWQLTHITGSEAHGFLRITVALTTHTTQLQCLHLAIWLLESFEWLLGGCLLTQVKSLYETQVSRYGSASSFKAYRIFLFYHPPVGNVSPSLRKVIAHLNKLYNLRFHVFSTNCVAEQTNNRKDFRLSKRH